ncbi:MAG: chemotaxis protein CheW [Leptospira sp.]|nr:chemotaxis protein CheW [Leptospira sp.]
MKIDTQLIIKSFIDESLDLLERAERSILDLEKNSGEEPVNEIFRAIHTIKGNSGLLDAPLIARLSHSFESVLNNVRDKTLNLSPDLIDLFLESVDSLRGLMSTPEETRNAKCDELVLRLNKIETNKEKGKTDQPENGAQRSVANGSAKQNGNGKYKFRLPMKHLNKAKDLNYNLALVTIDLAKGTNSDVIGFSEKIRNLSDQGVLLMRWPRIDSVNGESSDLLRSLYYLVVLTQEDPDEMLRKNGVEFISCKIVHTPGSKQNGIVTNGNGHETVNSGTGFPVEPEKQDQVSQAPVTIKDTDSFLKVPISLLNKLINMAGEATIARNQLTQRLESNPDPALHIIGKKISQLVTSLQESVMKTRLQELSFIFNKIPRLVRDLENKTGKEINLIIDGGTVELDKTLIDSISDPIMHMIRNAIDHGIETPEQREKKGKKKKGTLHISASLRGGNVFLSIKDDGKGLDIEKIKRTAISKGIKSKEELERMSKEDLIDLIFLPGFSTAESVTSSSGRGVGMDVVRTNFKNAGGSIDVTSIPDKETFISASLPQTLTILTCLLIKSDSNIYGLPQQNIAELILMDPALLSHLEGKYVYSLRGQLLPLLELNKIMGIEKEKSETSGFIAVVTSEKYKYGLLIDEIINPEEIVVKSLGEYFNGLSLFSGAAILGNGEIMPVLDVPGIGKFANLQISFTEESDLKQESKRSTDSTGYILLDVYGKNFAVYAKDVSRIERIIRDQIETTMGTETIHLNGELVPVYHMNRLYKVQENLQKIELFTLIFNINGHKAGLIVSEIKNIIGELAGFETGKISGDYIVGHSILENQTTILIDAISLLENQESKNLIGVN